VDTGLALHFIHGIALLTGRAIHTELLRGVKAMWAVFQKRSEKGKRVKFSYLVLVASLWLAFGVRAWSTPIAFHFEGYITQRVVVTTDPFDGQIDVGTPFFGTYTFHSDTPNSGSSDYGVYLENDPTSGIDVTVGAFSGSSSTAVLPLNYRIILNQGHVQDIQTQGMNFAGVDSYLLQLFLEDETSSALSSVALSAVAPDLDLYQTRTFFLGLGDRFGGGANASTVYLGLVTDIRGVPEPPTISLLFMAGLLAVFTQYRKDARRGEAGKCPRAYPLAAERYR